MKLENVSKYIRNIDGSITAINISDLSKNLILNCDKKKNKKKKEKMK
jgi:hypothetical protein